MTGVLSRRPRDRRGGPRPGWALLTALLVLAIVASSALVFTSRVELLKLAVIIALWAAVVAAFVSVIYRRQSDVDRARARDLKLVYNLQLDREISARREYELTVESQLRRELAAELRAQAADEVAALRGELAALRNNLEVLFGADLGDRPALEHDPTTVHAYSDWDRDEDPHIDDRAPVDRPITRPEPVAGQTDESPIIDVPEVGLSGPMETVEPVGGPWRSATEDHDRYGRIDTQHPGARHRYAEGRDRHQPESRASHRRAIDDQPGHWAPQPPPSDPAPPMSGRHRPPAPSPPPAAHQPPPPRPAPPPPPTSSPRRPQTPHPPPAPAWSSEPAPPTRWQPAPPGGRWLPPGAPGSNWDADRAADAAPPAGGPEPRPRHRRHVAEPARHAGEPVEPSPVEPSPGEPGPVEPNPDHVARTVAAADEPRRARHSVDPTEPEMPTATTPPTFGTGPDSGSHPVARHRESEPESRSRRDAATGGQSVADLLARLQTTGTGGRRRRRRDE